MEKLKTTRKISDLSTEEIAGFLYDLQFLYKPFFYELRQELTKRVDTSNKVFQYKGAKWRCDHDTLGGCFRKLKKVK